MKIYILNALKYNEENYLIAVNSSAYSSIDEAASAVKKQTARAKKILIDEGLSKEEIETYIKSAQDIDKRKSKKRTSVDEVIAYVEVPTIKGSYYVWRLTPKKLDDETASLK